MKTKEELNALKEEVEAVNKKLAELSEDELMQVTGGTVVLHNMPKIKDDEKYVMKGLDKSIACNPYDEQMI